MSEHPHRKKKIRCNTLQKNKLVAFMAKNKDLARGPAAGLMDIETQNLKWKIIERELAKLGPPRTVEQWKITWRDLKCRAKMSLTPGLWTKYRSKCPNYVTPNTAQDKLILSIIGHTTPIPIAGAPESSIDMPPLPSGYQKLKSKLLESSHVPENTEIEIEVSEENSINHKHTIFKCEVDGIRTTDYEEKDGTSVEDGMDPLSSSCHSGPNIYEVEEEELNESGPEIIDDGHSDDNRSDQEVNMIDHHDYTTFKTEPQRSKIKMPYSTDELKRFYLRRKVENACLEKEKLLLEISQAKEKHQLEMLILRNQLNTLS